ncbi:M3 family oligoendopeptidase [Paenibacillus sp. KS-LC4]|uniref:M3 family oligoendopeptidase n=1 Tax=Paenibacillus sp. KS-LC4 TaxID=2979727 RepID=UPI0030CFBD76
MSVGHYSLTWNLDSIYAGGAGSEAFAAELAAVQEELSELEELLAAPQEGAAYLNKVTELVQSVLLRMRQSDSFVACLTAQNMKDKAATALNDRIKTLNAAFQGALTRYDNVLRNVDDASWAAWISEGAAAEIAFSLTERREQAKEKLSPELESLIEDMAVDGYHGWGDLYNLVVSRAKFNDVDADGVKRELSAGQMFNKLSASDRTVRQAAFAEWEREWGEQADLCADALNRISGFRLKLYGKRGWESALKEPLQMNRMSEKTIGAMWSAINEGKPELVKYMQRKAKLLGVEQMDWHDMYASIGTAEKVVSYDEGAAQILEQFAKFSPELAAFSEKAFVDQWIEVEDRPGKRPGGFCTSLPKSKETRIFMTYSGTASNVSTLAHELGHAYHQHVMNDLPAYSQEYAMNVAETASTFAELIVSDSALKAAVGKDEKIALLEEKLSSAVSFFMDIHARFLFETRFYERRAEGMLTVEELNKLMEEAQREAFCGAFGQVHPLFWASKLHFYFTDVPFYNFPYTFGYLFSAGIYARAVKEGAAFADRYVALLQDTGRMTVEDLAQKHLGVNLEEPDFWREAVALTTADVKLFLEMTEE